MFTRIMFIGKLIGTIVGLPFGIFGVCLGLIIGALLDRVIPLLWRDQHSENFLLRGTMSNRLKPLSKPAAALALSVKLSIIDQTMDNSLKNFVIGHIASYFKIKDSQFLQDLWIASIRHEAEMNLSWLIRIYGLNDEGFHGRNFLFRLFISIACQDEKGMSKEEYTLICAIFEPMGLGKREIQRELRQQPSLNREYCKILGLDPSCTEQDLKRRYREIASTLHPDSSSHTNSSEFTRIQSTYKELLWQFRYYDTR